MGEPLASANPSRIKMLESRLLAPTQPVPSVVDRVATRTPDSDDYLRSPASTSRDEVHMPPLPPPTSTVAITNNNHHQYMQNPFSLPRVSDDIEDFTSSHSGDTPTAVVNNPPPVSGYFSFQTIGTSTSTNNTNTGDTGQQTPTQQLVQHPAAQPQQLSLQAQTNPQPQPTLQTQPTFVCPQPQHDMISEPPKNKRKFQQFEDQKIVEGVNKFGDRAWEGIAQWANLGRTPEQLKNRYRRLQKDKREKSPSRKPPTPTLTQHQSSQAQSQFVQGAASPGRSSPAPYARLNIQPTSPGRPQSNTAPTPTQMDPLATNTLTNHTALNLNSFEPGDEPEPKRQRTSSIGPTNTKQPSIIQPNTISQAQTPAHPQSQTQAQTQAQAQAQTANHTAMPSQMQPPQVGLIAQTPPPQQTQQTLQTQHTQQTQQNQQTYNTPVTTAIAGAPQPTPGTLEAYHFTVQRPEGAQSEDRVRVQQLEAALKAKTEALQSRENDVRQLSHELQERATRANADAKEVGRLQLVVGAYHKQLKEKDDKFNERDDRVRKELTRILRELGNEERAHTREKNIRESIRLGRIRQQRTGTMLAEIWEDGEAFKQLCLEQQQLAERKEALEQLKKVLARKKSNLGEGGKGKKDGEDTKVANSSVVASSALPLGAADDDLFGIPISLGPQSSNNLSANNANSLTEQMIMEEVLKLRIQNLKKLESALVDRKEELEREKSLFLRELKRAADEENSAFNNFPCLGQNSRYLLLHLLGKGGFSEVYKAYDMDEMRYVACKIHQLNPHWSEQKKDNYLRHATRECSIQRSIDHPRFVKLYDVFKIDSKSFCTVLELCEGCDLDFHLKMHKVISEREARSIVAQIFSGLGYLNEQKQRVIHYDLKPGNILYFDGEVKITDFGLSKLLEEEAGDVELTSQGAGTYWYLPPECFEVGAKPPTISSKVDVWSVGVIMFQMLYGRRPFGHELSQQAIFSQRTILTAHRVEFPPKPPISDEAKEFIQTCLTFDQNLRPDVFAMLTHRYLQTLKK